MPTLSTRTARHAARGPSKCLSRKQDAGVPSPLRPVALSCLLACAGTPMGAVACDASDSATLGSCLAGTDSVINFAPGASITQTIPDVIDNRNRVVGITKNGAGTLELSGINSYTGDTTIAAGTLTAANGQALGNGIRVNFSGGTLRTLASMDLYREFGISDGSTGTIIAANGTNLGLVKGG